MEEKAAGGVELGYKFTAKELDQETGLYYFGARYYDAVVSRWVSVDPMIPEGKYLPKPQDFDDKHDFIWHELNDKDKIGKIPGYGGAYRSANLDPYSYTWNNPLRYIDPDGLKVNMNLVEKNSMTYASFQNTPSIKGKFIIGAHGNASEIVDSKGNPITPRGLAKMIKEHPDYKAGMTVRLLACNTGSKPKSGDVPFAQKLADALGVNVEAPNNFLWVLPSGNYGVAPRSWLPLGPGSSPGVLYSFEPRKDGK